MDKNEKGVFCIINLETLRPAEVLDDVPLAYGFLEEDRRPKCFYDDRGQAERELFRLVEKYPDGDFHLFGSLSSVTRSTVNPEASHIVDDDGADHIPF